MVRTITLYSGGGNVIKTWRNCDCICYEPEMGHLDFYQEGLHRQVIIGTGIVTMEVEDNWEEMAEF